MEDLSGKRFGRWTVVEYSHHRLNVIHWKCHCKCGNDKTVVGSSLRRGRSKSCGCLKAEIIKEGANTIHGRSRTTEYTIWRGIKDRCLNKNSRPYMYYGGRGITVCPEWIESFQNFYADMGSRPKGLSLDRIDNNKGYCKDNCKWATMKEQANNRRNNVLNKEAYSIL